MKEKYYERNLYYIKVGDYYLGKFTIDKENYKPTITHFSTCSDIEDTVVYSEDELGAARFVSQCLKNSFLIKRTIKSFETIEETLIDKY